MPITPERVAKLRAYGLSEYASRTYLALLDLGTAEARDISGISKVPASKIYRILEQLHEKGLVDILPEFPRKYAPVPFSDFLDKLHQEHKDAAQQIAREREVLAQMFAVVGDVESSDRGGFTVLRGRRNVMEKLEEIAAAGRRSMTILATPGLERRPAALASLLRAATERGVRVRLLLPPLPDDAEAPDGAPDATFPADVEVRRLARDGPAAPAGLVVLADGQRGLLAHFVPDDGHAFDGNDVAVASDQPGVVSILEALVEWPWREALDAQPLRDGGPARDVPIVHPEAADDLDDARLRSAMPEGTGLGLARF